MINVLAAMLLAAAAAQPPKNVILLIADGAGTGHFTVARNLRGENFRIGTMPVTGLHTTQCADRAVTDSAAAATALATGFKTNYEMVSVDPKTLAPYPTVLEQAEKRGKATGLVTTANFWDATPAAFAAHAKHRRDKGVDLQMLRSGAEVLAGTGEEDFSRELSPEAAQVAKENGYTVVNTRAQLDTAKGAKLLAYFPYQERNLDVPEAPLPVLAKWALDRLDDDPDGFFLMIEHEGTDSSSHQNHHVDLRKALTSFDEAVGVALDFAMKRGDTLVLVTSDHETGGLRVSETKTTSRWRIEWSTGDHTATAVPIFAYGPGAGAFAGFQDNTDVGKKLLAAVGKRN
ncbi:MAG TPA: alkaline phosphatase [Thermoanaerobaculia bacterium]|nr:alkaline phosphatase [Thermoanaerobaculia bacterium]